jgi:hypothetical protein
MTPEMSWWAWLIIGFVAASVLWMIPCSFLADWWQQARYEASQLRVRGCACHITRRDGGGRAA